MNRRTFCNQAGLCLLSSSIIGIVGCKKQPSTSVADNRPDFDPVESTIDTLQGLYKDGHYTIEEITQIFLNRIEAIDRTGPSINSVIHISDGALAAARKLDKELVEGKSRGPLHGIPVLLKDNIDTYDMPTTAGSRALMGSVPPDDATVTRKLREAGAVILGKTNLSEWANFRGEDSSSGWSGLGGLSKNPYVLDRNTCGSSAGSGSSVAASLCVIAIGTETNGSIVCPSTTNGIVGIKPTVGLISRSGIIPISYSQDTSGPMARTVKDAVIALGMVTGVDNDDDKTTQSVGHSMEDYTAHLIKNGLQGKRLAYFNASRGRHKETDDLMDLAIEDLKKAGAEVVEIKTIGPEGIGRESFNVMLHEYKQGLNDYFASLGPDAPIKSLEELIEFNKADSLEMKYFGQEYLEMAHKKGDLQSKEYLASLEKMHRGMQAEGIDRVMDEHMLDAIIAPTGSPAWKTDLVNGDTFTLGSSSPAAIAGYPNITVPMGFVGALPVGISIFGRAWSEPILIEIAYGYEQATNHRRPPRYLETLD